MTKLTQYIHHTIKERLLATAPIKSLGAKTTGPLFIDNDWHPKLSPCARYINWEILYNDPADSQKKNIHTPVLRRGYSMQTEPIT